MASFADLMANLRLNISGFTSNLQAANAKLSQFAANMNGKINNGIIEPTKKSGVEFKDVARIVQGIMISKVFYTSLNAIRSATNEVYEFSKSLEYAKIAYSNLFNDTSLAQEFINVLKDYAATTPFTFTESEQAAKRLLAYGVSYKNIMYMMQGIMGAAAMQGDPTKVEAISRALGQVYTKGRLMNEEMRQLAEAGIPAYEILRQKLGLTQKQLQNLGKEAIPANIAINALVDGMTERFGNVIKASTQTMTGIISNIKDNGTMLAQELFDPAFQRLKSFFNRVENFVSELRNIVETKGIGGVFERIIPPGLQDTVRTFIANLINLWTNLGKLREAGWRMFGQAVIGIIQALNMLMPFINATISVIGNLINYLTSNEKAMRILMGVLLACAAAWLVWRAYALGALVVTAVTKAIMGVITAIKWLATMLVTNPILVLLMALAAVMVYIAVSTNAANGAIRNFINTLTSLGGVNPNKLLQPVDKTNADNLDKFNNKLNETSKGLNKTADSANKAKKALLSFDEVFRIDENSGGIGAGSNPFDDIEIPDWNSEAFIPEIPDFTEFAGDFVTNLFGSIGDELKNIGLGALIGGIIGGLIGLALGNPLLGAAIGAFAGGLVVMFWDEIKAAFGFTDASAISIPIGGAIGAVIGLALGGPGGAAIGAAIGLLATSLYNWVFGALAKEFNKTPEDQMDAQIGMGIGVALGAIIGGILGGPAGVAIGAAVGGLAGGIGGMFKDEIVAYMLNPDTGTAIGGAIGAAIGMVMAGPGGAAVGLAIGSLVTWVVDQIANELDSDAAKTPWNQYWEGVGADLYDFTVSWDEFWRAQGASLQEQSAGWGDFWFNNDFSMQTEVDSWNAYWDGVGADLTTFGNDWNTFWQGVGGSLQGWTVDWDTYWQGVGGDLQGWTADWNTYWEGVGGDLATWTQDWANYWGGSSTDLGTFSNDWNTFWEGVGTALFGWTEDWNTYWEGVGADLATWTTDFINFWGDLATAAWEDFFKPIGDWIGTAIDDIGKFFGLTSNPVEIDTTAGADRSYGHATGGVFNREHYARFAEGNKAEAIIPLENDSAMQPFVDAVSQGIMQVMAPMMANRGGTEDLRPLYVGNLVADERGLRELYRKFKVIEMSEKGRTS